MAYAQSPKGRAKIDAGAQAARRPRRQEAAPGRVTAPPRGAARGLIRAMPTGAQLIVDLLEREGVEVAFGLPGVHNLALWEALRGSPIRLVGVRHEQAAAYAADGYARATGGSASR